MNKIKKAAGKIAKWVVDKAIGGGLSQDMTLLEGQRYITPGMYDSGLDDSLQITSG